MPGGRLLGVAAANQAELIRALEGGLSVEALDRVAGDLFAIASGSGEAPGRRAPRALLAELIGMSESTYRRRRKQRALSARESEGIHRYALLLERAQAVFGSLEAARGWLRGPVLALGGATPIDYARTEPGAAFVLQVLGRLEHGVYS